MGSTTASKKWLILGCALAVQVAIAAVATALPVLLPFVKSEFHLTFAEAGLVVNFSFFGSFLAIVVAGWLVDEFGDSIVLVLGCILVGVSAIASSLAPLFVLLLAFVLLMGIGIATPTPAGSTAVRGAFPLRLRGTVMGIRQAGFPLGGFVAALLLPMVAITAGWRTALLAVGVAAVVVGIACFFIYPTPQGRKRGTVKGRGLSMRPIFSRDVVVVGIAGTLLVGGQFVLVTFLIVYLIQDRHQSIATAGIVLAAAQLTGAIGRVAWGTISDRLLGGNRKGSLMLAGGVAAVGSLGLGVMPDYLSLGFVVIIVLVFAFGVLGWNGVLVSFLSELAAPGAEGRTVASGLAVMQPGILLGPLVFGLVVDSTQSFRLAWVLFAAILGVATLILSRTPDRVST
jgi:ACS family hexuronate transporter-like MFS transporter